MKLFFSSDLTSMAAQIGVFAKDFLSFAGRRAAFAFVLVAIGGVLEGAGLILIIPLLDIVTGESQSKSMLTESVQAVFSTLAITDKFSQISIVVGGFATLLVLRAIVLARRQVEVTALEAAYLSEKQSSLIETLGAARWDRIARLRHARITHLLGTDIYRVGQAATGLVDSSVACLLLTIYLTMALFVDAPLTLCAVGLLFAGALFAGTLFHQAKSLGETVTNAHLSLLNDTAQFMGALKLAVSQNAQGRFVANFSTVLRELKDREVNFVKAQNRIRMRLTIMGVLIASGTALIGFGFLGIRPAVLIALMLVLSRLSGPFMLLQQRAIMLIRSLPAFAQMQELKADLGAGFMKDGAEVPIAFGSVSFRNVTYIHGGNAERRAGLNGCDLEIPAGTFVGIAGASGSGKTTFADLLVGLYAPQSGAIFVDGKAAPLHLSPQWRDQLSYVSQDPFLRNDTVLNNLLWANPDASTADIAWALEVSGADAVIARMPSGLQTMVGERGALISGGERQRLAVARALLRRPSLLILDESTNAIDVDGEKRLLAGLDALRPSLTIVMIAHRPESMAFCDQIVLMRDGSVAAKGSYEALKPELAMAAELQPVID